MRALVTGGGGFLGRAIVEQLLTQGAQVRILARGRYPALEALGVECHQGDVRELVAVERACAGVDVVHHTAALAGIWGLWRDYFDTNVRGTRHVIAACKSHRVPKLVYTSSPSVTFDGGSQENIDERAPYASRWLCHYAHTKALAEQTVLAANGRELATCAATALDLGTGRSATHSPPDRTGADRRASPRGGRHESDRHGVRRQRGPCAARCRRGPAPGSPVAGNAYFISQGEPVGCWQWIDEILALAGLPPLAKSISTRAAWRVGALLETVYRLLRLSGEPRMTRFLAAQLGTSHYFDISRARRDFGYAPRVTTAEGMRRLGAWLQKSS